MTFHIASGSPKVIICPICYVTRPKIWKHLMGHTKFELVRYIQDVGRMNSRDD